jgi:hypothetical protein
MNETDDTLFRAACGDTFEKYMTKYKKPEEPVCDVLIRVGGTWLSGGDGYLQHPVADFFWHLCEVLLDLYDGEEEVTHSFMGRTWIVLERDGEEVMVERRVTEEDIGLEVSGTTDIDTLAWAVIEGANELLDSFDEYEDEDITKVNWLRDSLEELTERVEA